MDNGFILVSNLSEIGSFESDLMASVCIGLDTESSGLDFFSDRFLLLQISANNKIYVFDPIGLGKPGITYIVDLIARSGKQCIGHNIKYDLKVLAANTGILLSNVFDTMIVESVLTTGLGSGFSSLASILRKYLFLEIGKETREDFIGAYVVTQEMLLYAAIDVKHLIKLKETMDYFLTEEKLLHVAKLENDLIPEVAKMELEGVGINVELWKQLTKLAEKKVLDLGEQIRQESYEGVRSKIINGMNALQVFELLHIPVTRKGDRLALEAITDPESIMSAVNKSFNNNSNKQMLALLQLNGIPALNTNSKDLENLKNYPLVANLLNYRTYAKRVQSFGNDFIQHINPKTGRLHANFNQLGTRTGRWSSDNPNLQQIPRDTGDEDSKYRDCFIARPDHVLLTVDYNQAELRLLGAVAGEPEFIRAYNEGIDLHMLTASHIFHKPVEAVDKNERWVAKQVNFAICYGSTEYGLFYNFGIPLEEGRQHLATFFDAYSSIKYFVDYAGSKIWERKYSITPFGRKRYFEDKIIFSDYKEARKYRASVIRKGINTIIQGGSADILKLSFVEIGRENPFGKGLKILMAVHDEGVFEIHKDIVDVATKFVVDIMESNEQRFLGEIPAKVDYKVAEVWAKA